MKTNFAQPTLVQPILRQPTLLLGADVVWIDAVTPDPLAKDEFLTISQMAEKFGVTPRALRFYESKGLLAPAREGRARVYKQDDQQHLALILKGRKLGFTIAEISQMIAAENGHASPQVLKMTREKCLEQIELLERQVRDSEEALAELRRLHSSLCRV
jgi:DNA-binding transcriptional MerR regulator